jgi:arylformamidase
MFTLLSYPLGPQTPTYGKNPPVAVTPVSQIATPPVAIWFVLETIHHNGTHIDAPYHFNERGKRLTDLDINELIFTRPVVLDIPKKEGELITSGDFQHQRESIAQADLLLIRTRWAAACRSSDPLRYGGQAPGFAASAGWYCIEKLPRVRAIAMDLPSAASPATERGNEDGLEFHRIVLGAYGNPHDRSILLIEDTRIEPTLQTSQLQQVIVAPLWLEDLDGAPVTILAEVQE